MTQSTRSNVRRSFIPLLAAVIARSAGILFIDKSIIHPLPGRPGLLMEYGRIARNMLHGLGYAYTWLAPDHTPFTLVTAYMPPGQVWVDYACLALFGETFTAVVVIFFVNVIMGTIAVLLIGKIVAELFKSQHLERLALWCAALFPPFIYAAMTFGVASAVLLLEAWILLEAIRFMRAVRSGLSWRRHAIALGLAFGILCLFRGEGPVFLAAIVVYAIYVFRRSPVRIALASGTVLLLAAIVVAPWTLRNSSKIGRFVLVSSNGGFNFWRGNNVLTSTRSYRETNRPPWTTDSLWNGISSYRASASLFDEMNTVWYFTAAMHWIEEHPIRAAIADIKKGVVFWIGDFTHADAISAKYLFYAVNSLLALCFAFVGLARMLLAGRWPFGIGTIVAWCTAATGIAMLFFPAPRLQVLLIAAYFPVSVFGVDICRKRLSKRRTIL